MAYNILKGKVQFSDAATGSIESMVDTHADQTVGGTKTFSQALTASMGLSSSVGVVAGSFTGDGSGLSAVTAAGVTISNDGNNRVLTANGDTTLQAEQNMKFNGTKLEILGDISASVNISGSAFYGDASNLTNLARGANTQVQFNNSNALAGDSTFIFNNSTKQVSVTTLSASTNISASGFVGSAAGLTGLPIASYTNNGNNRIITSVNSDTVNAESNLLFDGNKLSATGQISASLGVSGSFGDFRTVRVSSIIGGSPVSISASSIAVTGSLTLSGTSIVSASSGIYTSLSASTATINTLTASVISGGSPITISADTVTINGPVSASSNVSASAFYGDGANLTNTGLISTYSNAANNRILTSVNASSIRGETGLTYDGSELLVTGDISASVNISASQFYGDGGNLSNLAKGNSTQVQFNNNFALAGDSTFLFNNSTKQLSATTISASTNISASGFEGQFFETPATFINNTHISSSLNVSASQFYGDGSQLTNVGGAVTSYTNSTNNRVLTSVDADTINGEANLTFDGSKLLITGDVSASVNVSASQFYGDGGNLSNLARGGNTQVQFNNNFALNGDSTFTFNIGSKQVSVTSLSASTNISASGFEGQFFETPGVFINNTHLSSSLNVSGSQFYGDGSNLTNINATALAGQVPAGSINIGNGLFNNSNSLAVSASNLSLEVDATGVKIKGAGSTSGLAVGSNGLRADPNRATSKGTLAANDEFLLADSADSNNLKKSTLASIVTITQENGAAGANTQVQFNNSNAFSGDSTFIFNNSTKQLSVTTLSASTSISASQFYGDGSQLTNVAGGAQSGYNSFTANFTVADDHDIMGIVTTGSAITASLAAASTYNPGQRFTFKDVSGSCSGSNHIVISASAHTPIGDRIDGQGIVKIQVGFGSITIASDGINSFYIVGTN